MIKIAVSGLLRNKTGLLTGISGTALAVLLMLIIEGFSAGIITQATAYIKNTGADIFLIQKGAENLGDSFIPGTLEKDIENFDGIDKVASILVIPVILDVGRNKTTVNLYGFNPDSDIGGPWKLFKGHMPENDNEVVLDRVLADRNGLKLDGKVEILGGEFKIAGLSDQTNSFMYSSVFLTQSAVKKRLNNLALISSVLIKAGNEYDIEVLIDGLARKYTDFNIVSRSEMADKTEKQLKDVLGPPINVILAISFLVGMMVAGLTAHVMALGRLKEYGVLKAIGISNKRLLSIVFAETVVWTILGYLIGMFLSLGISWLIMEAFPQYNIDIRLDSIEKVFILIIIFSFLSTISPVRRVSRIDPVRVFNN